MAHKFSFDLPGDPASVLAKASSAVTAGGGTLSRDANVGSFSGRTPMGEVKGNYRVSGKTVTIEVTDKPFVVPKSVVELKVRGFFGA